MGALRLLPGETEHLRLHPAHVAVWVPLAWAATLLLYGALLWALFRSPWWAGHQPSEWTAPWTWLWGNGPAAYAWTTAGILATGAVAALPRRSWRRLWGAGATAFAVAMAAGATGQAAERALPFATMAAAVPFLAWAEARRLATTYHVTNLRLAVRAALPARLEQSVLYSDLVDLDVKPAPWPDTGTLRPVLARPRDKEAPPAAMAVPGVRPLRRVRRLVEALAKRAGAAGRGKELEADAQVRQALAALGRPHAKTD